MKSPTIHHLTLAMAVFAAGTLAGCAWSAALFATTGGILAADLLSSQSSSQRALNRPAFCNGETG